MNPPRYLKAGEIMRLGIARARRQRQKVAAFRR